MAVSCPYGGCSLQPTASAAAYGPTNSPAVAARKRRAIAPTSHKMGIVVPYDRQSEVGYRCLEPKGKELRALLDRLDQGRARAEDEAELDALVNWATIANDECDFGASLQLGAEIFNHSTKFASLASRLLSTAYTLLDRPAYAEIARLHGAQRKQAS